MNSQISKALIFDSVFDSYKWVVAYIKVINWTFKAWQNIHLIYGQKNITLTEVWHFNPDYVSDKEITSWQIWYIITGQKSVRDIKIWDTILWWVTSQHSPTEIADQAIPWFKKIKPFVYAWVYPLSNDEFDKLREAFERLSLNDSAIEYEYENSNAMWFGFRCGFLGMLHMDIVKERLSREYKVETIFTTPSVIYLVKSKQLSLDQIKSWKNIVELVKSGLYKQLVKYLITKWKWGLEEFFSDQWEPKQEYNDDQIISLLQEPAKAWVIVRSWWDMIPNGAIEETLEPIAEVEVVGPQEFYGNISELCQDYRGILKANEYLDDRVIWRYMMPMGEMIIDFYDKLKSLTKWYATMNYDFKWYVQSDVDKLDILINGELVESFSMIIHSSKAYERGSEIIIKLKELIPRHLFSIPLQAAIWTKVIARENIWAIKKDVLAKCYGWDISRKRKLLNKQKEWKKKMKEIGRVSMPSDIFIKMVTR